jgi:hypothetical protein
MKRKSLLESRKMFTPSDAIFKCVRCTRDVTPGHCRTGKCVDQRCFMRIKGVERLRGSHEYIETSKSVGFYKYKHGFLCDECCASYNTIDLTGGKWIYEVIVDPLPGTIGVLKVPLVESTRTTETFEIKKGSFQHAHHKQNRGR